MITEGSVVKAHYTLTVDGNVVDSSRKSEPFEFHVGSNQVIPGFEKAFIGMKQGEKKSFQVNPDDGYGQENPSAIHKVPKDKLPPDPKPEAGMVLYATTPNGQTINGRIIEIKDDIVVVNFNHPLAGKTLNFEVEVIEIN
ncbi:MAG: peptidylprolyl isomerase [Nitrospirota bacterium]